MLLILSLENSDAHPVEIEVYCSGRMPFILLVVLTLFVGCLHANHVFASPLVNMGSQDRLDARNYQEVLRGASLTATVDLIKDSPDFIEWKGTAPPVAKPFELIWTRFGIHNDQTKDRDLNIEVNFSFISELTLFYTDATGNKQEVTVGKDYSYNNRPVSSPNYVFPVTIPPGESMFYIRAVSAFPLILPVAVSTHQGLSDYAQLNYCLIGLYMGIVTALMAYNFFLFLSIRDICYFYYFVFMGASMVASVGVNGYLDQIFPETPYWGRNLTNILSGVAVIFSCIFVSKLLETKTKLPLCHKIFMGVAIIGALLSVGSAMAVPRINLVLIALIFIYSLFIPFVALLLIKKSLQPGLSLFFAFLFMCLGAMLNSLYYAGIIYNDWLMWSLPAGQCIEAILLSFALAAKINQLRASQYAAEIAVQRAEAESQGKTQFLAQMSHEIRTPMNGVIGMAELLKDTPLSSSQSHYVDIINSSGKALLNVINDILDYSKIIAGKMTLEKVEFDLVNLIEESAQVFLVPLKKKNLRFFCQYSPELGRTVRGDSSRLRQVIINLLGNAIKFTEHGLIRLNVFPIPNTSGQVRFEIIDTGIGISEEAQRRLFSAFEQADASTTRKFGGTGLGLAICKQLAEMMGGEIGVVSQEGNGSNFWFSAHINDAISEPTPPLLASFKIIHVASYADFAQEVERQFAVFGGKLNTILYPSHAYPDVADFVLVSAEAWQNSEYNKKLIEWLKSIKTNIFIYSELSTNVAENVCLIDVRVTRDLPFPLLPVRMVERVLEVLGHKKSSVELSADDNASKKLASLRILVAEDNKVNQVVIKGMLEKLQQHVDFAENGLLAVAKVIENHAAYDCVLMDCEMPELDGYEATSQIREWEAKNATRRLPIIAASAHIMEEHVRKTRDVGMDDNLCKPIRVAELRQALLKVASAQTS